jgi:hypothetical protein
MSYSNKIKQLLSSFDPKEREIVKRVNEDMLRAKATNGTVHNNATMSNLSVQYKNGDYIGDQLMPFVTVAHKSDDYFTYSKRDRLSGPDDAVGNRSRPNELTENRSTATYSCKDYALMNYVDNEMLRDQDAPLDEMVDLIESINDVMALKREQRVASILTTSGNYSGNTAALAGNFQWADAAGAEGSTSNPIIDIQTAMAALWMGAGAGDLVGFTSLEVMNALSRHTKIRGLFQYTSEGLATADQVARFFGLSKILVGSARQDTANEGQTASYSRVWGKHFGIVRVARNPSIRNAAFGYTFRLKGDPKTDFWYDQAVGKTGGWYARVGTSEDHKVVAADTGYLLTSVIA